MVNHSITIYWYCYYHKNYVNFHLPKTIFNEIFMPRKHRLSTQQMKQGMVAIFTPTFPDTATP
jgi:hypothetical protein